MWSYYGNKCKVINYYPAPLQDIIIEPFAGSARYSLKYWEKDVLLIDKYEVVVRIWKWLQQCSANDILSLPTLKAGDKIDRNEYDCIEQAWFMGFLISAATRNPKLTVSPFGAKQMESEKRRMAADIHKIKHWSIIEGDYKDVINSKATWFIDPPYQYGGEHYVKSNKHINYTHLAEWCRSRDGQVIVCENTKADWLHFQPMKQMQGAKHKTIEAIWSNYVTNYDSEQGLLFKTTS
jgi:16S rRNA G966 N2-methylase RsmD